MRLIDADAMTADLLTVDPQFEAMIHWCLTVLDAQPTVDAVEVIRCGKCKHWQEVDLHFHRSICLKNMCSFEENDYCSKAERRQDES